MTTDHGLAQRHLEVIKQILTPCADHITQVALFGSRATGHYRPNSDVDLVLYGDIPERLVDRLWTMFQESSLPFSVDIQSYDLITYPPIKRHIDRVRRPVFTQSDLKDV